MAKFAIAGRSFEIPKYSLGMIREASPFIDEMNKLRGSLTDMSAVTESAEVMAEILAVGLRKIEPEMSAQFIMDNSSLDDMGSIQQAAMDVLIEAGLSPKGEATPPSEPLTVEGA